MNTTYSNIDGKQQNSVVDSTTGKNTLFPARITGPQVCQILGYTEKDVNILVKANHLKPLDRKDAIVSRKWKYASVYIRALATDESWLEKAEAILHNLFDEQTKAKRNKDAHPRTEKEGAAI